MRRIAALLAIGLTLAACAPDPGAEEAGSGGTSATTAATTSVATTAPSTTTMVAPAAAERLAEARSRWESAMVAAYVYTYQLFCECDEATAGPNTVAVTDGEVVAVRRADPGQFVGPDPQLPGWTVEQLFADIAASIERGEQVDVDFDPELGYPTTIRLDLESIPVDGGFSMDITVFADQSAARQALAEAEQRWTEAAPASYSYTLERRCFCVPLTMEIEVSNGEILRTAVIEGEEGDSLVLSIEELFEVVADALDEHPAELRVEYDAELGYPTEIWVDLEEYLADEEYGYGVELTVTG